MKWPDWLLWAVVLLAFITIMLVLYSLTLGYHGCSLQ